MCADIIKARIDKVSNHTFEIGIRHSNYLDFEPTARPMKPRSELYNRALSLQNLLSFEMILCK